MSTITGLELRPLTIPLQVEAIDAADFVAMVEMRNLIYREISGHSDNDMTPAAMLPHYRPNDDELRIAWLVVADGEPVGRASIDFPREEGSRVAYTLIELRRSAWGRGIGTLAHDLLESTAREHDRTILQSWAEHPSAEGEHVHPPTGFGSIPLDHAARFYLRHGYTLEQVERESALDLTAGMDHIRALLARAESAASGYRVVQWTLPTPAERADGYAWMKSRMSTDVPAGALEFDEETWDAARIERHDQRYIDGGRTVLVTAAEHIGTGELCAFNELVIGDDRTVATHQEDTLVLTEHRGHRLGLLVKCAGLVAWRQIAPESPRVITYNAEENRPMLSINEEIGFRPISYEGAWKKVLGKT